jgi:hypothetical protein
MRRRGSDGRAWIEEIWQQCDDQRWQFTACLVPAILHYCFENGRFEPRATSQLPFFSGTAKVSFA